MKAHGISSTTMLQQRGANGSSTSPGEPRPRERANKKRKLSAALKQPKTEVAEDDLEDIKPSVKIEAVKNEQGDDEEEYIAEDGSFTKTNPSPLASGLSPAEAGHHVVVGSGRSDDEVYLISASDKMGSHADSFADGHRSSSASFMEKMQGAPTTNFHADSSLLPQTISSSLTAGFDSTNWVMNPELASFF